MENLVEDLQLLLDDTWIWLWLWQRDEKFDCDMEHRGWGLFSPEHNSLIEKSYLAQQKEVDLENWIVSFEQMELINKKDPTLQTSIMRRKWNEVQKGRLTNKYFEKESSKPFNDEKWNLKDLLEFLTGINSEVRAFATLFEEYQKSNNVDELNKTICPEIQSCITKEFLKLCPDQPQSDTMLPIQKKIQFKERLNKEKLILSFREHFQTFEDFFAQILKMYTMDTFLYRNLNKYLRDENWQEITELLPYAFCLCKAFLRRRETEQPYFLTLYRGTLLNEAAIRNLQTTPDPFSWYSIISTTKRKEIVEKFIIKTGQDKKHSVIFVIHVKGFLGCLDVSRYSVFPEEEEVLLPPASTFMIQAVSRDENGIIIIDLRLIDSQQFDIQANGFTLQYTVQQQMLLSGDRLFRLRAKELCAALRHVREYSDRTVVELYLCTLNNESLEELIRILSTFKKAKLIKFVLCSYEDDGEISSKASISKTEFSLPAIQIYEGQNFYQIFVVSKLWVSLKQLSIIFKRMTNEGISMFSSQALQHLLHLTSLNLDFADSLDITDKGIDELSGGLKYPTKLNSLSLNFSGCFQISMEGVSNLFNGSLGKLLELKILDLDFSSCDKLAKEAINDACSQSLRHLIDLKVSVKAYSSRLKRVVLAIGSFLGLISNGRQLAIQPFLRSDDNLFVEKVIADLLLKATDFESETKESMSCQSLKNIVLDWEGKEALIDDLISRCKRFEFFKWNLEESKLDFLSRSEESKFKDIRRLKPKYLNFEMFLKTLTEKLYNLRNRFFRFESDFPPLHLKLCPFWMRDKKIDDFLLKELEQYIRQTSESLECCESTVELLLEHWFETTPFGELQGSIFEFDDSVELASQIIRESLKQKIPSQFDAKKSTHLSQEDENASPKRFVREL